jgi:hypothetical protein
MLPKAAQKDPDARRGKASSKVVPAVRRSEEAAAGTRQLDFFGGPD